MWRRIGLCSGVGLCVLLAACGGDDTGESTTTREIVTEPTTTEVEVQVPTVDTSVVERTVETDVDVDVDTVQRPEVEETQP